MARKLCGKLPCPLGIFPKAGRTQKALLIEKEAFVSHLALSAGDVITHFNGRRVRFVVDLNDCLCGHKAGDEAKLRLWREGKALAVNAPLFAVQPKK